MGFESFETPGYATLLPGYDVSIFNIVVNRYTVLMIYEINYFMIYMYLLSLLGIIMTNIIPLSDLTRTLIVKLQPTLITGLDVNCMSLKQDRLCSVLNQFKTKDHQQQFLLESLRAALLSDLRRSLLVKPESEENDWTARVKFWSLFITGMVIAACGGFDAVDTFLSAMTFPTWFVPVIIGIFVIGSMVSFYAFDLGQISDYLGVKLPEMRRILDVYVEQAQEINLIRKKVNEQMKSRPTIETLRNLLQLVHMLKIQQKHLLSLQNEYKRELNAGHVHLIRKIITVATGVVYFSSGYFASQTPIIALVTFLGLSTSAMAVPILLFGLFSGIVAFALYWHVQRPGLDHFIAHWFGLDPDKIAELDNCKISTLTGKEINAMDKLRSLKRRLEHAYHTCIAKDEHRDVNALSAPVVQSFFARSQEVKEEATQTEADLFLATYS